MFDGDPVIRKLSTEIERAHSRNAELLSEASELAADLRRVMAENERLRAALKPFADYADPRNGVPPSFQITAGSPLARKQLLMQDCYRARDALTHEQSASGEVRR